MLSEFEPIPIDEGVGVRDKRREDTFSLNDPAISLMRLVSDCLSLDMMILVSRNAEKRPADANLGTWQLCQISVHKTTMFYFYFY